MKTKTLLFNNKDTVHIVPLFCISLSVTLIHCVPLEEKPILKERENILYHKIKQNNMVGLIKIVCEALVLYYNSKLKITSTTFGETSFPN